jgi:hypothetical protein
MRLESAVRLARQYGLPENYDDAGNGIRTYCPRCESKQKTFWIGEIDGHIWTKCHRAACEANTARKGPTGMLMQLGLSFADAIKITKEENPFGYDEELEKEDEFNMMPTQHVLRPPDKRAIDESELIFYDYCPTYLLDRGFSMEALQHFQVGYDNKTQMITIPVRDENKKLIGLTKRIPFDSENLSKYFHDFVKETILFNLWRIAEGDSVYIVEGPLDVIRNYQNGIPNSAASFGSVLTEHQIRLLMKRRVRPILIAEGDPGGLLGTVKSVDRLSKFGLNPQICLTPIGKDPGDMSREELLECIGRPIGEFQFKTEFWRNV